VQPKKILVIYAHPRPDLSEINKPLFETLKDQDNITAIDLYSEYSSFDINVEREKRRLTQHDVLVFQHPIYWYSCPALLKDWMDLVLEYNFAYGPQGRALKNKIFVSVVSSGGSKQSYSREGSKTHTLRDFLLPFDESFKLCQMRTLPPLALYSAGKSRSNGEFDEHKRMYHNLLEDLKLDKIDFKEANSFESLNDYYKVRH
jgi:putative NADPH-quinone reductase